MIKSRIAIDLFSPTGQVTATFSGRAKNRSYVKSRNQADIIEWSLDQHDVEKYCRDNKLDSQALFIPYKTVIAVRYGTEYLAAGLFVKKSTSFTATKQTLNIRAWGWLNVLQKRIHSAVYTSMDSSDVFALVLAALQDMDNGDLGLTIGHTEEVGELSSKTFDRTRGKDALQNLTRLQIAPFDFKFNYDKTVDVYKRLGTSKPHIIISYPGNIIEFNINDDSSDITNAVHAVGSGDAGLSADAEDTSSQLDYTYLEEDIQSNAAVVQTEVQEDADNYLNLKKRPFLIPQPIVRFGKTLRPTDIDIGDYVTFRISNYHMWDGLNRMFRIERIEANWDNNDKGTARLYLDV